MADHTRRALGRQSNPHPHCRGLTPTGSDPGGLGQGQAGLAQQLRGLVQGQAHDAGVAAGDVFDELRGRALDAVAAGLVVRLLAGAVSGNRFRRQHAEAHFGHLRDLALEGGAAYRNRGEHLVRAARQLIEHGRGFRRVGGLAEDMAVDGDGGVGSEHGARREVAAAQQVVREPGLFQRHAGHVRQRRFAGQHFFGHVGAARAVRAQQQQFEIDAHLAQQFAPARALGSEIDFFIDQPGVHGHTRW